MIYKDSENGIVKGVCAGLANSFDLSTTGVRIVVFVSFLIFTCATLLVYITAACLLRNRPLHFDRSRERQFWQRSHHHRYDRNYR